MVSAMNIENVKVLTEILCANGLTAIEVGEGENRIRIEKEAVAVLERTQPSVVASPNPAIAAEYTAVNTQSVDFNRLTEVKSPLVGVFYSAASPDSETFVGIGSKVEKDDVLCIIETMKLMNEILAEQDGEIVDICVKNGDIVEFGQVLFKMF